MSNHTKITICRAIIIGIGCAIVAPDIETATGLSLIFVCLIPRIAGGEDDE